MLKRIKNHSKVRAAGGLQATRTHLRSHCCPSCLVELVPCLIVDGSFPAVTALHIKHSACFSGSHSVWDGCLLRGAAKS